MYKSNPAKVRQAQAAAVEIVSELNTTNYVHQYSTVQYSTILYYSQTTVIANNCIRLGD